jgi:hypothetical protein
MNHIMVKDFSFIEQKDTIWISGVEICRKLRYKNPPQQAEKIWSKHKEELSRHSVVTKLVTTDFKKYQTRAYNERGARFFITKCNRPLADKITMEMIECFIRLRDERQETAGYRSHGKTLMRDLTDKLQSTLLDEPNTEKHKYLYANVAKCNCKAVTGKTPKQIREERGVEMTRDAFTKEELVQIAALESYQAKYLEKHPKDRKSTYQAVKEISQRFELFSKELEYMD